MGRKPTFFSTIVCLLAIGATASCLCGRDLPGTGKINIFDGTAKVVVVARWMNVQTGEPSAPWLKQLRLVLQKCESVPVIVLAQQSLQWVFGERREGIRGPDDGERIKRGADAQRYSRRRARAGPMDADEEVLSEDQLKRALLVP